MQTPCFPQKHWVIAYDLSSSTIDIPRQTLLDLLPGYYTLILVHIFIHLASEFNIQLLIIMEFIGFFPSGYC